MAALGSMVSGVENLATRVPKTPPAPKKNLVSGSGNDIESLLKSQEKSTEKYISESGKIAGDIATKEAGIAKESAQKYETFMGDKSYQYAEFEPTRENSKDLLGLFSLLGTMAFMSGGAGRQSGLMAMSAMTGALDGYKKGQKDVFQREMQEFDKRMKEMQSHNELVGKQIDNFMKGMQVNKEAAMAELAPLRVSLGQNKASYDAMTGNFKNLVDYKKHLQDMNFKLQSLREQIAARHQAAQDAAQMRATMVGQRGAAADRRYAFNMAESFGQAATDILNVTMLPKGTVLGAFAGMTGQSGNTLIKSLENTFARKVTDKDSRAMQQIVAGLDQNMGRTLGGGYAQSSAKHLIEAYKEQVARQGDSPASQALFLARMKQELKVFAKTFATHPGASQEQANLINEYVKDLDNAVPFSVPDVLTTIRKGRGTVGGEMESLVNSPVVVPPLQPSAAVPIAQNGFDKWKQDLTESLRKQGKPMNYSDAELMDYYQKTHGGK